MLELQLAPEGPRCPGGHKQVPASTPCGAEQDVMDTLGGAIWSLSAPGVQVRGRQQVRRNLVSYSYGRLAYDAADSSTSSFSYSYVQVRGRFARGGRGPAGVDEGQAYRG